MNAKPLCYYSLPISLQQIPLYVTLIYNRHYRFCVRHGRRGQMYDYEKGSEQELIRRARRGDAKAFAKLYSGIYKDLYKFALCMLRHPQEAEDAVSEAVIAAYENISGLKKESSFRSWIFKILSNQCRQTLTRRQREIVSTEDTHIYLGKSGGNEPDYAQQQDVRRAFESLDEEERMIVAFSVFGGYTSEEIAVMLKKKAVTVRSRKSRALEKMRVDLGRAEG